MQPPRGIIRLVPRPANTAPFMPKKSTLFPRTHVVARILLVEDEPKLRESLLEGLQLEQWDATGAATGAEALREIETQPFDLIVLDWMLPDCEGLEVVRQLRAKGSTTPVLLVTARGGNANRERAFEAGATDFLAKPFSFDELLSRARALLDPTR
jgi:DNA-binding response OmpR family regulator